MAIVYQRSLFSWKDIDDLGDLEHLVMVLESLPDEKLMSKLEKERKGRRNDYPVRAVWNSLVACIIYGHPSISSLIRELQRNPSLREVCGFDPLFGVETVPTNNVYTNFLKRLMKHQNLLDDVLQGVPLLFEVLFDMSGLTITGGTPFAEADEFFLLDQ